jgi:hypothetical protein
VLQVVLKHPAFQVQGIRNGLRRESFNHLCKIFKNAHPHKHTLFCIKMPAPTLDPLYPTPGAGIKTIPAFGKYQEVVKDNTTSTNTQHTRKSFKEFSELCFCDGKLLSEEMLA